MQNIRKWEGGPKTTGERNVKTKYCQKEMSLKSAFKARWSPKRVIGNDKFHCCLQTHYGICGAQIVVFYSILWRSDFGGCCLESSKTHLVLSIQFYQPLDQEHLHDRNVYFLENGDITKDKSLWRHNKLDTFDISSISIYIRDQSHNSPHTQCWTVTF